MKTRKANSAFLSVLGLILALATLAATVFYGIFSLTVQEAYTWKSQFVSQQPTAQVEQSIGWLRGQLYYGVSQTQGTAATTKYNFDYRQGSGAWNRLWTNGYANKNNTWYGPYSAHATSGVNKYGYKLIRVTNLSTTSAMTIHFGVK
jgi:hypothetical protein